MVRFCLHSHFTIFFCMFVASCAPASVLINATSAVPVERPRFEACKGRLGSILGHQNYFMITSLLFVFSVEDITLWNSSCWSVHVDAASCLILVVLVEPVLISPALLLHGSRGTVSKDAGTLSIGEAFAMLWDQSVAHGVGHGAQFIITIIRQTDGTHSSDRVHAPLCLVDWSVKLHESDVILWAEVWMCIGQDSVQISCLILTFYLILSMNYNFLWYPVQSVRGSTYASNINTEVNLGLFPVVVEWN